MRRVYKNYIFWAILLVVIFLFFNVVMKSFQSETRDIYVRVRVGQGYWWATTAQPSEWLLASMRKGDSQRDLAGREIAKIVAKRAYPAWINDQFETYVDVKIRAAYNGKSKKFLFNRSPIAVGEPIDFEFLNSHFSGSITSISNTAKFDQDKLVEKEIYLTKRLAYPWEYDAIRIGDKYFDGENVVFEILDKSAADTTFLSTDQYGSGGPGTTENRMYITVKAKIMVHEIDSKYVYGEDNIIVPGVETALATQSFDFNQFVVSKIE